MNTPRILLADDEPAITAELVPFLERSGFEVSVARWYRGTRDGGFHAAGLIVLDVLMPGLTGREVCRRMRAAGNWTPVIMLTQVGISGERAMSLEEGAAGNLSDVRRSFLNAPNVQKR